MTKPPTTYKGTKTFLRTVSQLSHTRNHGPSLHLNPNVLKGGLGWALGEESEERYLRVVGVEVGSVDVESDHYIM